MPRAGWTKPVSDRRLSDLVSVGVLTRVFPPALVDEVVAASGRREQRNRTLPARVMTYFAVGMALHAEGSYEDVLSQLSDGLSWSAAAAGGGRGDGDGDDEVVAAGSVALPSKSAIFQARARLGSEPVRALFERVAVPLAQPGTPGAWLAGRRLVAVDGMCLDVPDTVVNEGFFGRPGVAKGERAAFPMARVVALAECATHAVFAARVGAYTDSEPTLIEQLLTSFGPGMVVLADRGVFSFALWRTATATGADLLWRIRTDPLGPRPVHVRDLPDGSWLAHLRKSTDRHSEPMLVRVVDYTLDDGRRAGAQHPGHPGDAPPARSYRLFTTITDPAQASATDLADAYRQRWEIETTFDELKTHQRGPRAVLRSKSPDLVLQEIWGHLCCHYAIRTLMSDTAAHTAHRGHDPDRVSFVAALRIARQSLAGTQGGFPP
ncbi:MAG TPA: IS4 family transposase [Propionicimonas sp.]|nr:IS4 family transposase [Propionicimonas sp.]